MSIIFMVERQKDNLVGVIGMQPVLANYTLFSLKLILHLS
jgi:hypothetical protein